jgi:hypothetical protein
MAVGRRRHLSCLSLHARPPSLKQTPPPQSKAHFSPPLILGPPMLSLFWSLKKNTTKFSIRTNIVRQLLFFCSCGGVMEGDKVCVCVVRVVEQRKKVGQGDESIFMRGGSPLAN